MKKLVVAFDVDGTLRCNHTETCRDVNPRVVEGLYFMRHMKNVSIMVWSGGGADYARNFCREHNIGERGICFASKLDQSTWKWGRPDIAVDDMQSCEMGTINLIVREK